MARVVGLLVLLRATSLHWGLKDGGLVSQSCHNRVPQTRWFKQLKCAASRLWRTEGGDRGGSGVGSV